MLTLLDCRLLIEAVQINFLLEHTMENVFMSSCIGNIFSSRGPSEQMGDADRRQISNRMGPRATSINFNVRTESIQELEVFPNKTLVVPFKHYYNDLYPILNYGPFSTRTKMIIRMPVPFLDSKRFWGRRLPRFGRVAFPVCTRNSHCE